MIRAFKVRRVFLETVVLRKSTLFIVFIALVGFVVLVRLAGDVKNPLPAVAPSKGTFENSTDVAGMQGSLFWEGVQDETIKEYGKRQGIWEEGVKSSGEQAAKDAGSNDSSSDQAQGAAGKNSADTDKTKVGRGNFFMEYRLERDRIRGQQVDWLREIVNNQNSNEESRRDAQKKLLSLSQNLEKEMQIENLIRANGYKDAVVFFQTNAMTVIVQAKSLRDSDITKISSIINRFANVDKQNIDIIPKN